MKILTIEEEAANLKRRFAGVNRAEFARDHQLKGGQSMIYQNITARRPISMDAAIAYAKGFGCSLEDISPRLALEATGAARHLDGAGGGRPFDQNVSSASPGRRAIPVISAVQAGKMKEVTEPYPPGEGCATLYADDDYSRWAFALVIEGDSMLPDFRPGDLVIVDPEWEPRPGDCVVAKNGKEEATFKKYRQRGVDSSGEAIFELVPLNPDYPTVRSDETSLRIIGVMAEHRRKTRRR